MIEQHPQHALEDLVPDYLNGHLDEASLAQVEHAMEHDAAFRRLVTNEQQLRDAIAEPGQSELPAPDFDRFLTAVTEEAGLVEAAAKPRDEPGSAAKRFMRPLAIAAAVIAVTVVSIPLTTETDAPEARFDTLSSPVSYDVPVLRITLHSNGALPMLLQEYDAEVVRTYPDANSADVVARSGSLERLETALAGHPDVVLLQQVEPR